MKTAFFPHASGRPAFVLDVSVASAWLLHSRAGAYTSWVLGQMMRQAAVPANWPADVAQAVLDGERHGEVTASQATQFLVRFRNYLIHLDNGRQPHVWTATVPLARRLNLPVGRAAYLELALRLKLPLASTDPALLVAAPLAGVARLTP